MSQGAAEAFAIIFVAITFIWWMVALLTPRVCDRCKGRIPNHVKGRMCSLECWSESWGDPAA